MTKKVSGTREWSTRSANIQRGCGNNCHYCLHPDTLILMADGSYKKISSLHEGDEIIGARKVGGFYRYVKGFVKKIWTHTAPGFTIFLENGVRLKCSADHRWLTTRGWKRTARKRIYHYYRLGKRHPGECWRKIIKRKLLRFIGVPSETPPETKDYKKGYLYGAMRGDGTHGIYVYSKRGKGEGGSVIRSLRLANIDKEIVDYTKMCLKEILSIEAREFVFQNKPRVLYGIRSNKKHDHHRLSFFLNRFNPCEIQKKHPMRMRERSRGFLAGIFDAEGHSSGDFCTIRISNTDEDILHKIEKSFDNLGFKYKREKYGINKCSTIRIVGGRKENIRFFSVVNPKIRRKFRLAGNRLRGSIIIKDVSRKSPKSELLYDMETTTHNFIANGCISHNCYARYDAMSRFRTIASPEEWIRPRVNPELVNKKWKKIFGRIMFPTQHDIVPENLNDCLTALHNMLDAGNEVLIVSKPRIRCVERLCEDLITLKDAVMFRFTIGAMDDNILRYWEPGAPSYAERVESLKCAFGNGYKTSVSCEPCLDIPGFIVLFRALEPWVTDGIWFGMMNKIDSRVQVKTESDQLSVDRMKHLQTKFNYQQIYEHLKGEPKIRWKREVREILGLPLMQVAGEDR